MAKEVGLTESALLRIYKAFGLQPHRPQTWKLSNDLSSSTTSATSSGCTRTARASRAVRRSGVLDPGGGRRRASGYELRSALRASLRSQPLSPQPRRFNKTPLFDRLCNFATPLAVGRVRRSGCRGAEPAGRSAAAAGVVSGALLRVWSAA